MKTLFFLLISITTFSQTTLNVKAVVDDKLMYCTEQIITSRVTNRRIQVYCEKFQLDLKIVKKRLGEHRSWLGKTKNNEYYYITSEYLGGPHYIAVFQPCEKNLNTINFLPTFIISSANICK